MSEYFFRGEYFSGVNICQGWIFLGWIFFRVNIILIWIFPSEDYHSLLGLAYAFLVLIFSGQICIGAIQIAFSISAHEVLIMVLHELPHFRLTCLFGVTWCHSSSRRCVSVSHTHTQSMSVWSWSETAIPQFPFQVQGIMKRLKSYSNVHSLKIIKYHLRWR